MPLPVSSEIGKTRKEDFSMKNLENIYAELANDEQFKREMFRASVGGMLAGLVHSCGRSAAAIARKCGMKASQLSRQLSGDINLTLDTIHRIASAAHGTVKIEFILGDGHAAYSGSIPQAIEVIEALQCDGGSLETVDLMSSISLSTFNRIDAADYLLQEYLKQMNDTSSAWQVMSPEAANEESFGKYQMQA